MKKLSSILAGVAIGVALIVTMAVSMFACSPTRSSKSAVMGRADSITSAHIAEMLTNRLYKVDFTRAFPLSAPSFSLSYNYYVSVIDNRVESYLPYFGRAYNIPYGGGEGLRFDAPMTGYKMTAGRKGQYEITFDARTGEDRYTFNLEVHPTGESYLTVLAAQRQSISFSGAIDFDPEFEAVRITE